MDEVITCKCGNQEWVIGTGGIRCAKCTYFLTPEMLAYFDDNAEIDVQAINETIKNQLP